MKLSLLQKAYWDIAKDWPNALRIVLGPWLSIKILTFCLNFYYFGGAWASGHEINTLPPDSSYHITVFVLNLLEIVVLVWIAVAWHRYILLKERAARNLPAWIGKLNWRYFSRLVPVTLLSIAPFLASIAIYSQVSGVAPDYSLIPNTSGQSLITLSLLLLFGCISTSYLLLRFGAALPAIAAGSVVGILDAWRGTKGLNAELIYCAALLGTAGAVIVVVNHMFARFDAIIIVLSALSGFLSLLSLSLLTSVYSNLDIK